MSENWQDGVLGETSGAHVLTGLSDIQDVSCAMAKQSRRHLYLYVQRLNADIYAQSGFLEAVKSLATHHVSTRIRILVADTEHLRSNGHRLVGLAQQLSSSVEIRRRAEQFSEDLRSYMLADDSGYVLRPIWHDLHNASASFRDRSRVRSLTESFTDAWELSEPDQGLRQLYI